MKKGITRWVFFFGTYAIKVPSFSRYRMFLSGIIANINEWEYYRYSEHKDKLCPVLLKGPLGLFIVMPKVRVLEYMEVPFADLMAHCYQGHERQVIPAEIKHNSFGYLNGRLVAIDYG